MVYGVGIVGAGPGVGALHIPTLARLSDQFRLVHVSDAGSGRATVLAERAGARASSGIDDLLADELVDVVAICSPPDRHAEQVLAAVAAGARAVLCEKPLATTVDDAERVIEACRAAGTTLLVGTNHLFDDAWGRTKHHLVASGGPVRTVSVAMSLAPNPRYHAAVTDDPPVLPHRGGAPDIADPNVAAAIVRQLVVGLAVHDLPLVRDLAPGPVELVYARAVAPVGFAIGYRAGDVLVQLTAVMHQDGADTLWRMGISTADDRIEVEFPPPFVHAGSAAVRVRAPDGRWTNYRGAADDGYLQEWRALAALMRAGGPIEYEDILDDARYAIELADAAATSIRREVAR
jgi:predicted dehydrogenase